MQMLGKIVRFIFFGNYFIGVLAIALSLETSLQLRLPFNSIEYYALLFCGTVMYYTYAYAGILHSLTAGNQRAAWYQQRQKLVRVSQWLLLIACLVFGVLLLIKSADSLLRLPVIYWFVVVGIGLANILYYGLLPRSLIKLNLRNTGWLKAFVIGFVWAASVSLLPIVMLQLEHQNYFADPVIIIWLFIKNWMFCTVNAIMFDLKDYEDDSNKQLKTFVVRFGLRNTILFVLTPLCLVGMFFTGIFAQYRHFTFLPVAFNLLPFLLLLAVTYSMQKQKNIFFYLIVIDGLVFVKAICGIIGMMFVSS
jgi:4-hydroxybenzoate polyprenyltransferase